MGCSKRIVGESAVVGGGRAVVGECACNLASVCNLALSSIDARESMPASTRGVSAEISISARGVPAEMSISARGVPALTNRPQRRRTMRSTAPSRSASATSRSASAPSRSASAPSRSASARHGAFGGVVLSVVRGSPLRDSLLGNGVVLSDSL